MEGRARLRACVLVASVASALAMALVVATVCTGSVFGAPATPHDHRPRGFATVHRPELAYPGGSSIPEWVGVALMALLVVGIVTLMFLARGERRPVPDRPEREDEEEDGQEGADWDGLVLAELANAAAEQLDGLRHGSPRNAIVACWLRLQQAASEAGMRTRSWETSQEYTVRALHRLRLDPPAINTLSSLYREARFSEHEMSESHRDEALAALTRLAAQLPATSSKALAPRASLDSVSP
jgi:hypothetical protein